MKFTLNINPATLSSAQLKVMSFRMRRIITNPKVRKAMTVIEKAVMPYAKQMHDIWEAAPFHAVAMEIVFWFPFPATGTKKEKAARVSGQPVVSAKYGDVDNRAKAPVDALKKAGCYEDDRFVSTLLLRKRYTHSVPRIDIRFEVDAGGYDDDLFTLQERRPETTPVFP